MCASLSLPEGILVRLEVLFCGRGSGRSSMHVQSLSEWAPANIGPYSQAYTVSEWWTHTAALGLGVVITCASLYIQCTCIIRKVFSRATEHCFVHCVIGQSNYI